MQRIVYYSILTLLLFIFKHSAIAQIEVPVKFAPDWKILQDSSNVTLATDHADWIGLNRKNYPAVLRKGLRYEYNWYALASGDLRVPSGYKYPTQQDFNDYGHLFYEEKSKIIQKVPVWIYENTPNDSEYAPQITFDYALNAYHFLKKAKSEPAIISLIEKEEHFYTNVFKDKKFEELSDECDEATAELFSNLSGYFSSRVKDYVREGNSFFIQYKGNLKFNADEKPFSRSSFELLSSHSNTEEEINRVNNQIDDWANKKYPICSNLKLNKKFRITTFQPIHIDVSNTSNREEFGRKKLLRNGISFCNYTRTDLDIPYGYKKAIRYQFTKNRIQATIMQEKIIDTTYSYLEQFSIRKSYKIKPLLALIGCANTKDANLYKWFYTSLALTGVAYLSKNAIYNRYLKNPSERQGAYFFANSFYRISLLGGLTIGTVMIIDAGKGIRNYKKAVAKVRAENEYLEKVVWK